MAHTVKMRQAAYRYIFTFARGQAQNPFTAFQYLLETPPQLPYDAGMLPVTGYTCPAPSVSQTAAADMTQQPIPSVMAQANLPVFKASAQRQAIE